MCKYHKKDTSKLKMVFWFFVFVFVSVFFFFFLENKSLKYLGIKDILVLNDKLGTKFTKKRYL